MRFPRTQTPIHILIVPVNTVFHNGIIENYLELKEELCDHTFTSETDTEVIAHLIEIELEDNLVDAVNRVIDRLEGSFAFAIIAAGHDSIVTARQDSPLVVGYGEDGNFVASDVPAFLEHTRDVTYLQDGDVARVTDEAVTIYADGETSTVGHISSIGADAAEKGGYAHYKLKEIHEQSRALRQTRWGRIDDINAEATIEVDLPNEHLDSLEEIQIVAAGTSYHAGLYAELPTETHADIRVSVDVASEYDFNGGRDPW